MSTRPCRNHGLRSTWSGRFAPTLVALQPVVPNAFVFRAQNSGVSCCWSWLKCRDFWRQNRASAGLRLESPPECKQFMSTLGIDDVRVRPSAETDMTIVAMMEDCSCRTEGPEIKFRFDRAMWRLREDAGFSSGRVVVTVTTGSTLAAAHLLESSNTCRHLRPCLQAGPMQSEKGSKQRARHGSETSLIETRRKRWRQRDSEVHEVNRCRCHIAISNPSSLGTQ